MENSLKWGNSLQLHVSKKRFLEAVETVGSVKELCILLGKTKPSVYTYAKRYGIPLKRRWLGARLRKDGYISYKASTNHRRIGERVLGRKLNRNECVHHIDGDKTNNENWNLLICTVAYHSWLHHRMSYLYQQEKFGGK